MNCFVKFEFLIAWVLGRGNWKQKVKTTNWPFSIFSFWCSKYWRMMFNFTFLSNKHWKSRLWSFDFQFSILNENQMDENHTNQSWPGLTEIPVIPPSETCELFWAIFAFTTLFSSWNMVLQPNFFQSFRQRTKSTSSYQ